ncbi:MAG: SH3 domain-containing protein [Elainellaceae cyanobacterium]
MTLGGILKFITGFGVAIALLVGGGIATTRYLITRFTAPPPRPVFSEELPEQTIATSSEPASSEPEVSPSSEQPAASSPADPSPTPSAEPSASPSPELDPNAYEARVVQPIGLVLRQGPSTDTTRIGGVGFNEQIIVLSESSDGAWLNVRLPGSGVEGWIKAGNTEQIN